MKRFEELMNIPQNLEHYECLKNDVCREKLAVLFGAGLSLGEKSTRWGYPFEWTYHKLNNWFDSLKNHIKDTVERNGLSFDDILENPTTDEEREIRQDISSIQNLLKEVEYHNNSGEYLEAGDALAKILEGLGKPCNNWGMQFKLDGKPIPIITFNDFFVAAFKEDNFEKADKIYSSPYTIPAIFYLPYISRNLITTNVDSSFEKVRARIKNSNWHPTIIMPYDNVSDWDPNSNSIFYIHGHISRPDSLVMSKAQYDYMYPERINAYDDPRGVRALLGNTIKNYSLLFLGAKLQTDRTVKVINWESSRNNTLKHRNCENLRLYHMEQTDSYGRLVAPDRLNFSEPIKYNDDQHREITLLLLQLIRETASNWAHCSWMKPESKSDFHDIPDSLKKEIVDSFERLDIYESITVDRSEDGSADNLIHYLYDHHSIQKHDKGLGWSICCVNENEFSLGAPEGETFPLHNYPVGDTVYVFFSRQKEHGEWSLYKEEVYKRIEPSIRAWRKNCFPSYPNAPDVEEFNGFSPRIRVIFFSLPSAPNAKDQERNNVIEEIVCEIDGFLMKMRSSSLTTEEISSLSLSFLMKLHSEIGRMRRGNIENSNVEVITDLLNRAPIKTLKR